MYPGIQPRRRRNLWDVEPNIGGAATQQSWMQRYGMPPPPLRPDGSLNPNPYTKPWRPIPPPQPVTTAGPPIESKPWPPDFGSPMPPTLDGGGGVNPNPYTGPVLPDLQRPMSTEPPPTMTTQPITPWSPSPQPGPSDSPASGGFPPLNYGPPSGMRPGLLPPPPPLPPSGGNYDFNPGGGGGYTTQPITPYVSQPPSTPPYSVAQNYNPPQTAPSPFYPSQEPQAIPRFAYGTSSFYGGLPPELSMYGGTSAAYDSPQPSSTYMFGGTQEAPTTYQSPPSFFPSTSQYGTPQPTYQSGPSETDYQPPAPTYPTDPWTAYGGAPTGGGIGGGTAPAPPTTPAPATAPPAPTAGPPPPTTAPAPTAGPPPPTTTAPAPPSYSAPSYGPEVWSSLPSLLYLKQLMGQGDYWRGNPNPTDVASLGISLPSLNSLNYNTLQDIRAGGGWDILNSGFNAGNRNLAAEEAWARARAPIGSGYNQSLIQTGW